MSSSDTETKSCRRCGAPVPNALLDAPLCNACFERQERRRNIIGCLGSLIFWAAIGATLWFGGRWLFTWSGQMAAGRSQITVQLIVSGFVACLGLALLGGSAFASDTPGDNTLRGALTAGGFALLALAATTAAVAVIGLVIN